MINKDTPPGKVSELRQRAEYNALNKTVPMQELKSPEETGRLLHELRVHQIELEMQNEELLQTSVELETSYMKYFDLFDLAPVGYLTLNGKGLIMEANLTSTELLGAERISLVNLPVTRFIFIDAQEIYSAHHKLLSETGTVQTFELKMIHQDGSTFWVLMELSVIQADDGKPCFYKVVINDINKLKLAEQELREIAKRLSFETLLADLSARFIKMPADRVIEEIENAQRNVCEYLHIDISILWQVFLDHPRTMLNTHYYSLLEFSQLPEALDINDNVPWCWGKLLKGESVILSALTDAPASAARDLEFWHQYDYKSILALPLSTGGGPIFGALIFTTIQTEITWSVELVGRLQLVAQIFANALARKHAEQILRESEARYRGIFEGAMEGVYRTTAQGNNLVVNPAFAKMMGYDSPQELVSEVVDLSRQVWADAEERDRFIRHLDEQETLRDYQCQFVRKDGTKIWISLNIRVARGIDGKVDYFEGFIEDITDRKQMEEQLRQSLKEVQRLRDQLQQENMYLREEVKFLNKHANIVGETKVIKNVLAMAEEVSSTNSTVLILGETGTGKELLAYAIHNMSNRKDRALVIVNCASLPPTLIESELFGREKGAYTGSLTKMLGRFELADGSTLFLDEIGDLPIELQGKLLRVIEQGQFERLGSTRTIKVNVRIIAATNRDLAKDLNEGRFRKDLYYRLNVFPITIPPLRERKEDIPALVWSFVKDFEKTLGKIIKGIPKKNMEALMHYDWPGNIRELRNIIEHAMIMNHAGNLDIEPPCSVFKGDSSCTITSIEHRHILNVLKRTCWRIAGQNGAAEILGMNRTTLHSKMKKLGITRPIK
jgi:formate hydrogenlyase transcriptional activator